jgi:sugar phosphate isomerase/epimerase
MGAFELAVSGTELEESDGTPELVALARAARCDAVEFWYPKNAARDGVDATLRGLERAGVSVACVSTPSELYGSGSAGAEELLVQAVELARRTGANRVNTYFGHAPVVDDAAAVEAYAFAIAPLLDRAASADVTIVLENEFDAFGWDPAGSDVSRRPPSLAALCERVGSEQFGLNFDAANFLCAEVDPATEALPLLAEWVRYAHVKDVVRVAPDTAAPDGWNRYADQERWYDTVPLGHGDLDWPSLVHQFAAAGYEGYLTLEPHCARSGLLDELARAADYLRTIL